MSSIEERLVRDIAAVTGGVVMTAAYLSNSDADPKGAGPAGVQEKTRAMTDQERAFLTGDAPSVESLSGVWRLDNGVTAYQFSDDLTVRFHDSGRLFSDSASTGTYEIDTENRQIAITTVRSDDAACVGTTTSFWASVPNPGNVRMIAIDTTPGCSPVSFGRQVLEGLSPVQTFGAGYAAELVREKGWKPLTGTNLKGLFSDGDGRLLELDFDSPGPGGNGAGRYYVVDRTNEVVDQGTWSAGDARLVLTSSAESATCQAGDRLVLSGVEQHPQSQHDFRGTVTQNTCGGDWTSPAWAAVPSLLTE